jgi:hypothetical protein
VLHPRPHDVAVVGDVLDHGGAVLPAGGVHQLLENRGCKTYTPLNSGMAAATPRTRRSR